MQGSQGVGEELKIKNLLRRAALKTRSPLILTARIADSDLQPFDLLRQKHFPPDRNHLHAHLTMFHRLPGEYMDQVVKRLQCAAEGTKPIAAEVSGVRHLGAGVAFAITSPELHALHATLRTSFAQWLGSQDLRKWQPHITIQNKVPRSAADGLYRDLIDGFQLYRIKIVGLDLWRYLNGPWGGETSVMFEEAC